MKSSSVKSEVLNWMRTLHMGGEEWIYEGRIDDYMRQITGSKGGTTERRLRELREDGLIQKDENSKYNRYRIPQRTYEANLFPAKI